MSIILVCSAIGVGLVSVAIIRWQQTKINVKHKTKFRKGRIAAYYESREKLAEGE